MKEDSFLFLAASSKKPSITHEDVNSIFLNRFIIYFYMLKTKIYF